MNSSLLKLSITSNEPTRGKSRTATLDSCGFSETLISRRFPEFPLALKLAAALDSSAVDEAKDAVPGSGTNDQEQQPNQAGGPGDGQANAQS